MTSPNDPHSRETHTTTHREIRTEERGRGAMWFIVGGLVVAVVLTAALFLTRDGDTATDSPAAAVEDTADPGAETTAPTTAEETAGGGEPAVEPATGEATPADEPAPAEQPADPAPADVAEPPTAEPSVAPSAEPPPEED